MNSSAFAEQARGNDPGVVKDHKVVWTEQIRKARKVRVRNSAGGAAQQQESGSITVLERTLGNLRCRQVIIEVYCSHNDASVA